MDNAAKTAITIRVTATDIARGKRHDTRSCPVSLAAQRALKTKKLWVFYDSMSCDLNHLVRYRLSHPAPDFIEDFDRSGEGSPFSFTATLVSEV